jgi:hypothetical protein
MAAKENVNPLKTLVISMGFLLIGGFIFLAAVVWQKVSTEAMNAKTQAECPGGQVDLKGHGTVVSTEMEKRTMRLTLKNPSGRLEVVTLNMCTGAIESTLSIVVDTNTNYFKELID